MTIRYIRVSQTTLNEENVNTMLIIKEELNHYDTKDQLKLFILKYLHFNLKREQEKLILKDGKENIN